MKHDDFLKQLNAELDSVELPMSEQLKNEPIKTAEKQTNNDHSTGAGVRLTTIWGIFCKKLSTATSSFCPAPFTSIPFLRT